MTSFFFLSDLFSPASRLAALFTLQVTVHTSASCVFVLICASVVLLLIHLLVKRSLNPLFESFLPPLTYLV